MKIWTKPKLLVTLLIWLILKNSTALGYSQKIRVLIHSGQDPLSINALDKVKAFNYRNRKFIRVFTTNEAPIICKAAPLGIEIGGHTIQTDLILLATFDQSPLRVQNRWYRGEIIIHKDTNFQLEVINELDLELYLQGIMKQEISPRWPEPCLKAQAIVARSYALYEKRRNLDALYDLKASTESQAYLGIDGEDPATNLAIADTRGMILMADGQPLPAFYHACCGGHTEWAANIFGDYPAVPGVLCRFCQDSPHYAWEVRFYDIQVRNYLLRSEMKVGPIKSIQPIGRTSSGRVQEISIRHTLGNLRIPAKKFRQIVGYNRLPSLRFKVTEEENEENEGSGKTFLFTGQGWGHGVGLCQWGSKKMAEEGATCEEILHMYYPLASLSHGE